MAKHHRKQNLLAAIATKALVTMDCRPDFAADRPFEEEYSSIAVYVQRLNPTRDRGLRNCDDVIALKSVGSWRNWQTQQTWTP